VTRIVAADIGGTHARFAIAELVPGESPRLGAMKRYRTREYPGIAAAWERFAQESGAELPSAAAIAVAAPIEGETLRFMNSDWRIPRFGLADELGLEQLTLLNDYGAVAHAVSVLGEDELARGMAVVKDLRNGGQQQEVAIESLVADASSIRAPR